MKIEFYKHNIGSKEIKNLNKVLHSVFLTAGPVTREFEEKLAKYLQCKKAAGLNSCTAALFLSLKAFDIGPGDEVITTPMTFIATANAIIHAGARPVFVDVEKETGNINANLIEAAVTAKTKAIIPVHLYGQICDMKKIREIANRYHLVIIEDAAHALEGMRDGIRPGQLGDIACFSFYATKNITCGEGGAAASNNIEIIEKIKKLRNHGMSKNAADRYVGKYNHWDMELLGWKFNMDDIHAALLINQLRMVEKYLSRREKICQKYEKAFKEMKNLGLIKILDNSRSGRHLFTVLVKNGQRDEILDKLQEKGIGVAVNYRAIHLLKYYRETFGYREGIFPVAEDIGARTLTIPMYPELGDHQVDYIIKSLCKAVLD